MHLNCRSIVPIGLLVLSTMAHASQRDDVGYTQLQDRLGGNTPTGRGITVSAYEPESHAIGEQGSGKPMGWIPAVAEENNHVNTIEMYQGAPLDIKSGNTSSHAAAVSRFMFGKEHGVSQELDAVKFNSLEDFIGATLYPRTTYQAINSFYRDTVFESSVNNFSATGNFNQNNIALLRRFDWATAREDVINLISSGNNENSVAAPVFSSSLNGIYVGLTGGQHSRYTDSFHYSEQTRPDVVAPNVNTSRGTGTITGITAVLMETASTAELSDFGITQANTLIRNAERSETMKAILMAGADRATTNSRENAFPREKDGSRKKDENGKALPYYIADINNYRKSDEDKTTNGLDTRYGAGQANAETSYDILIAGEQASVEDGGEQSISLLGFDYDESFGLGFNDQQANATASYILPTLEEDSDIAITLAWNADVASYDGEFSTVAVYDLDLWLYQIIDDEETLVASSTSDRANTENIWASLEAGGDYFFRVDTTKNLVALLWDYAIAWRVTEQPSSSLSVATSSVPVPSSLILFATGLSCILLKKRFQ